MYFLHVSLGGTSSDRPRLRLKSCSSRRAQQLHVLNAKLLAVRSPQHTGQRAAGRRPMTLWVGKRLMSVAQSALPACPSGGWWLRSRLMCAERQGSCSGSAGQRHLVPTCHTSICSTHRKPVQLVLQRCHAAEQQVEVGHGRLLGKRGVAQLGRQQGCSGRGARSSTAQMAVLAYRPAATSSPPPWPAHVPGIG